MNILQEKPARALVEILKHNSALKSSSKIYTYELASRVETTEAHTNNLVNQFEDKGYIVRQQDGRKKRIELTELGKEVARKVQDLKSSIRKVESGSNE